MIRIATVFSGIGAAEQALQQLGVEHEIVFACDNGERYLKQSFEEISSILDNFSGEYREQALRLLYESTGKPNNVKKSYFANYDIDESRWFEDIRFVDGKPYKGQVDLFVGGSPCQSFSTYGHKRGLEDTRGTLFYDYARLVKEIQPKAFIFENVTGMLTHDNKRTWQVIKDTFDMLNYDIKFEPCTPSKTAEYSRLWEKLTEPVEFHDVTVPYSDGTYSFRAYFSGVADELMMQQAGENFWQNLTVNFIAKSPAKR